MLQNPFRAAVYVARMTTTQPTAPDGSEHLAGDYVTADGRGRIALGANLAGRNYLRTEEPDGTVVLVPAIAVPASVMANIDAFIADPTTGRRRTRPERAGIIDDAA